MAHCAGGKVDLALGAISNLTGLISNQPFIGPFAGILQQGIQIFINFRTNQENAEIYRERLCDVALLINEVICEALADEAKNEQGFYLIRKTVEELQGIIKSSIKYFEAFKTKGFLNALMTGTRASDRFAEFDRQLTTKLNDLILGLGLSQQQLLAKTFRAIGDIETLLHDLGGLQAIASDSSKLDDLADKLGMSKRTITIAATDSLEINPQLNIQLL
jgi:hypothetical protein